VSVRFEELPGWEFEVLEVSAGVYRVTASDRAGRRVVAEGLDPEACLDECRASAMTIYKGRHDGRLD